MCKQITGYFLRLSSRRNLQSGKKDYLRRLDGKRVVLTRDELLKEIACLVDMGSLDFSVRPTYELEPDSEAAKVDPWSLLPAGTIESRDYTYQADVIGPDAQLVHRAGDVVRQVKVNGHWRDDDTRSAEEFEAAWKAALIKAPADLTDEDRRVLKAAEAE